MCVSFKQISFCNIFLCLLKYPASPFFNIRFFLFVYFRLFINLHIVIKSSLSYLLVLVYYMCVCVCDCVRECLYA